MADLEMRKLGRTGLNVTVLGFGAMELRAPGSAIRSGRPIDSGQADKVLNAALDGGINFIDTSIDYGQSEASIGEFISHRRNEYYLATKCGCNADAELIEAGTARGHVFTRENIRKGVHLSLRRMRTDYLDLVQFHGAPSHEMRDEAIQALQELKQEGKARFIGVSAVLPDVADLLETGVFDTVQVPYSALEREHEALITQAGKDGVGIVGRGGIARGEPHVGLAEPARWEKWNNAQLDEMLDGMDRFEFLLRFTISHGGLHTTIVGTLDPDHMARNLSAAAKGPLPALVYDEVKRRMDVLAGSQE